MKKSYKIMLIIDIIIGAVLIITGFKIHIDYYSTMIIAMGVGWLSSSIMQFIRHYHNTRPENIEAYREKVRQQSINLKDERKILLRNRAGYITWIATMAACFVIALIAAWIRADPFIVLAFTGAGISEYVMATIIYKHLCSKM